MVLFNIHLRTRTAEAAQGPQCTLSWQWAGSLWGWGCPSAVSDQLQARVGGTEHEQTSPTSGWAWFSVIAWNISNSNSQEAGWGCPQHWRALTVCAKGMWIPAGQGCWTIPGLLVRMWKSPECPERNTVSAGSFREILEMFSGCCEKSWGELLSAGLFTAGRHHPVQGELVILSHFEMSVETRGVFVSVLEWHWWGFSPVFTSFFICFLKKGYVNTVLA